MARREEGGFGRAGPREPTDSSPVDRNQQSARLRRRDRPYDFVIVGGGATGLGIAVDAASRGYEVALFEQADFAKGTSSRSTKLVHGGVRYLQQGNVALVIDALRERGLLRRNAPHLVSDLSFVVPSYSWWESPFYGIGLKVYDVLAGRFGFLPSKHLTKHEVLAQIPSIQPQGLRGGTRYSDGQFDDARLAINLAQTACEQGATVLNYMRVTGLLKSEGATVSGVQVQDEETQETLAVPSRVVINATGPFTDQVRRMDHPECEPIIAPSQGVHLVLDASFLPGDTAIMVPHTKDGRVMFAIPWNGVAVVGTTDTPRDGVELEPRPFEHEIEFLLETANRYLSRPANPTDILSVFTGIRPLVRNGGSSSTASLSRDHTLLIDPDSGLITIAGGKWTTYRKMAQDTVDQAADLAGLPPQECTTRRLNIHGFHSNAERFGALAFYGSDAPAIQHLIEENPDWSEPLHPRLPVNRAQVVWACRHEMARTVEDLLARRTRSLLLDASAAIEAAPLAGAWMAQELDRNANWVQQQAAEFQATAQRYRPPANP